MNFLKKTLTIVHKYTCIILSIADVARDGKDRYVTNVKYILAVDTATAMEVHGSVFAILTGEAFYVIKVICVQPQFKSINRKLFQQCMSFSVIPSVFPKNVFKSIFNCRQ